MLAYKRVSHHVNARCLSWKPKTAQSNLQAYYFSLFFSLKSIIFNSTVKSTFCKMLQFISYCIRCKKKYILKEIWKKTCISIKWLSAPLRTVSKSPLHNELYHSKSWWNYFFLNHAVNSCRVFIYFWEMSNKKKVFFWFYFCKNVFFNVVAKHALTF